jgi:precorrin-6y C5,15-methyltransferase (decarboxylating) CbiE subunit
MTPEASSAIADSRVVAGGARVLNAVRLPRSARRVELPASGMADAVVPILENESRISDVTLIVSGDPGFYSLAKKVISHFGRKNVTVIPGISSLQLMASRICRSWVGVASDTLHGRDIPDMSGLAVKLRASPALAVLFGASEEVAGHIGRMARDDELGAARAALGWDLGLPEERIFEASCLSGLEGAEHKGRLALLWLEKKGGVGDAG